MLDSFSRESLVVRDYLPQLVSAFIRWINNTCLINPVGWRILVIDYRCLNCEPRFAVVYVCFTDNNFAPGFLDKIYIN